MVNRMRVFSLIGFIVASIISLAANAALTATVDATSVGSGEPVQLSVKSDRETSGEPDFSVLSKDFEVLDTSQSQNISIINGSVSRETAWNLTLMPKKQGKLTIPPISLDGEKTQPITITASDVRKTPAAGAGQSIFLEATWDKPSAVVGAQRILTIRLYRAINTGSASLTEPQSDQAVIRKLAKDRVYETDRNGRRYKVNERRYAVFPQTPGELTISPVQFQGRIPTTGRRRSSPYSMFDDFGVDMDSFFGGGKPVRVWSPSIKLTVTPMPKGVDPDKWMPAKDVQLIQRWEPANPEFRVGEPVTRVISMLVDGQPVDQLVDLDLATPAGVKSYPDKPVENEQVTDDGIIGIREFKDVLVPEKSGALRLPAISVQWWDTDAEKMRTTTIDEQTINVSAAAAGTTPVKSPSAPKAAPVDAAPSGDADTNLAAPAESYEPVASATRQENSSLWKWLSLLFLALWLLTLAVWWKTRTGKSRTPSHKISADETNEKQLYKRLMNALSGGDAAAVESALIAWAGSFASDGSHRNRPVSSLGQLADLTDVREDPELAEKIRLLERFRYKDDGKGAFDVAQLKPLIERWRKRVARPKHHKKTVSGLKPLYQEGA